MLQGDSLTLTHIFLFFLQAWSNNYLHFNSFIKPSNFISFIPFNFHMDSLIFSSFIQLISFVIILYLIFHLQFGLSLILFRIHFRIYWFVDSIVRFSNLLLRYFLLWIVFNSCSLSFRLWLTWKIGLISLYLWKFMCCNVISTI